MTKRDKRALVFVNPAGGAGKAYRLVMEHVIGVWSESEFNHHIVITGKLIVSLDCYDSNHILQIQNMLAMLVIMLKRFNSPIGVVLF